MRPTWSSYVLASVFAVLVTPVLTWAVPVVGGSTFVAQTGEVMATFVGSDAAYTSELFLESPGNAPVAIFNNHSSLPGSSQSLGVFAAGTELIFRIHVLDTNTTYFNGPSFRNSDNSAHAIVDASFAPNQTLVGFEDLGGGGDRDYNDLMVSFTNTTLTITNPEPATLTLMATGVLGLLLWRGRTLRYSTRLWSAARSLKP